MILKTAVDRAKPQGTQRKTKTRAEKGTHRYGVFFTDQIFLEKSGAWIYRQFLRVIAEKKEGCSINCNPELSVEDTLYSLIILL
jgi:hypothetical protein